MIGTSLSIFLKAASAARPSIAPGITTSSSTAAGPLRMKAAHRFVGVGHGQRRIPARAEKRAKEPAHRQVVVDDHHLRFQTHTVHVPLFDIRPPHALQLSNRNATAEKSWHRTERRASRECRAR